MKNLQTYQEHLDPLDEGIIDWIKKKWSKYTGAKNIINDERKDAKKQYNEFINFLKRRGIELEIIGDKYKITSNETPEKIVKLIKREDYVIYDSRISKVTNSDTDYRNSDFLVKGDYPKLEYYPIKIDFSNDIMIEFNDYLKNKKIVDDILKRNIED